MKHKSARFAPAIWNLRNLPSTRGRLRRAKLELSGAAALSRELRFGKDGYLGRRRAIAGLSLVAIGAMGLISLYQIGALKHLPEPPLPKLNADRVDGSPEAYKRIQTPDAALGLGNYALTLALVEMGGKDRARKKPWVPLALAGKIAFDCSQSLRMIWQQWRKEKAFCFWCLLSAAATFTTAALAVGETREAMRELWHR